MPTARDNALNRIAREVLNLDTLESRKMDSLDFHEHAAAPAAIGGPTRRPTGTNTLRAM